MVGDHDGPPDGGDPTIDQPSKITLVDTPGGLNALLAALDNDVTLAVDTEFHAENLYIPKLMLVQIATRDGDVWVADAVRVDLAPLARALVAHPLIVHGGRHDVQLLHHLSGAWPTNIHDTQRMAALTGRGFPISLSSLAEDVSQVELDKKTTLTDWKKRPLTDDQVIYAAMDAVILFPLFDKLHAEAAAQGLDAYLTDVSREVVDEAMEIGSPLVWTGWNVAPRLSELERSLLTALLTWRQARALEKNRPLHYVLSDGLAIDLARRRPTTIEAMTANRRMPHGLVSRHGDELLELIVQTLRNPPEVPTVPDQRQMRVAHALRLWAEAREPATRVAPGVAMPDALARRIAVEGPSVVDGWRKKFFGHDLSLFLEGHQTIGISKSDLGIFETRDED